MRCGKTSLTGCPLLSRRTVTGTFLVRKSDRIAVDEAARLHPNDWCSLEVQVIDVSECGFRARCDARVPVGSRVTLEVPGLGPAEAQVSWRRHDEIGARFIEPVKLGRAGWTPLGREESLARLLVQRAAARQAGLVEQERSLRARILAALPVHRAPRRPA